MRYTYTPVHLRREPPPPLLGFREAPPVFASFLPSIPAHATRCPTRLRADERSPAARVVPPAFFLPPLDPSDAAAANALRGLADAAFHANGEAVTTTPKKPTTTAPRSGRKRSRAGLITPPKLMARDEPEERENALACRLAPPRPPPSRPKGGWKARPGPVTPVKPLEAMEYRELKNFFPAVFGRPTTSNNKGWIYKRIKDHFDEHGDPRVEHSNTHRDAMNAAPLKDATNNETLFSAA